MYESAYTSTSSCVLVEYCFINYRNNFTFIDNLTAVDSVVELARQFESCTRFQRSDGSVY
jgi:hypothetical protein